MCVGVVALDRGPRIDEVYVDEVQDFTQAELRLFLEVCHDKNALFLTGDTCQTIARGVGFRFEDLTTMFYHLAEVPQRAHPRARVGLSACSPPNSISLNACIARACTGPQGKPRRVWPPPRRCPQA